MENGHYIILYTSLDPINDFILVIYLQGVIMAKNREKMVKKLGKRGLYTTRGFSIVNTGPPSRDHNAYQKNSLQI